MPIISDGKAIQPHPRELRERCFELFKAGRQFVDIAHETRVAAPTIRSWASRERWKERVAIAQEQPGLSPDAQIALAIRQEQQIKIPDELREQAELYETNLAKASVILSHAVAEMQPDEMLQKSSKIKDLDTVARKCLKIEHVKPATVIQIGILSSDPNLHRVGPQQH